MLNIYEIKVVNFFDIKKLCLLLVYIECSNEKNVVQKILYIIIFRKCFRTNFSFRDSKVEGKK